MEPIAGTYGRAEGGLVGVRFMGAVAGVREYSVQLVMPRVLGELGQHGKFAGRLAGRAGVRGGATADGGIALLN